MNDNTVYSPNLTFTRTSIRWSIRLRHHALGSFDSIRLRSNEIVVDPRSSHPNVRSPVLIPSVCLSVVCPCPRRMEWNRIDRCSSFVWTGWVRPWCMDDGDDGAVDHNNNRAVLYWWCGWQKWITVPWSRHAWSRHTAAVHDAWVRMHYWVTGWYFGGKSTAGAIVSPWSIVVII